jgi:pilus assembly protein FimV
MPVTRRVLTALLLLVPFAAAALGLGDIHVASGLNQPFDARIPIIGAKPGEIVDLSAALAEQQAFERAGLARPYSLNRLKFSVVAGEGDSGYVHVTSREAVREPALEFIIEVKWRNGSMQRKYGVLLERK